MTGTSNKTLDLTPQAKVDLFSCFRFCLPKQQQETVIKSNRKVSFQTEQDSITVVPEELVDLDFTELDKALDDMNHHEPPVQDSEHLGATTSTTKVVADSNRSSTVNLMEFWRYLVSVILFGLWANQKKAIRNEPEPPLTDGSDKLPSTPVVESSAASKPATSNKPLTV